MKRAKRIKLVCKICGKEFERLEKYITYKKAHGVGAGKFCSKECFYKSPERSPSKGKFRKDNPLWKGRTNERGYDLVYCPNHPNAVMNGKGVPYIREHRLTMEKHLGRILEHDEVVHHINGNKKDNRLENLQLMKKGEHHSLHIKKYWRDKHENKQDLGNAKQKYILNKTNIRAT